MKIILKHTVNFSLDNITELSHTLVNQTAEKTEYNITCIPDKLQYNGKYVNVVKIPQVDYQNYRKIYPFASKTVWFTDILFRLKDTQCKQKSVCFLHDENGYILTIFVIDLKTFIFTVADEVEVVDGEIYLH